MPTKRQAAGWLIRLPLSLIAAQPLFWWSLHFGGRVITKGHLQAHKHSMGEDRGSVQGLKTHTNNRPPPSVLLMWKQGVKVPYR